MKKAMVFLVLIAGSFSYSAFAASDQEARKSILLLRDKIIEAENREHPICTSAAQSQLSGFYEINELYNEALNQQRFGVNASHIYQAIVMQSRVRINSLKSYGCVN